MAASGGTVRCRLAVRRFRISDKLAKETFRHKVGRILRRQKVWGRTYHHLPSTYATSVCAMSGRAPLGMSHLQLSHPIRAGPEVAGDDVFRDQMLFDSRLTTKRSEEEEEHDEICCRPERKNVRIE